MVNIASKEIMVRHKIEILEESIKIFSEGINKAGIAGIVRQISMGHGTVYRYYER